MLRATLERADFSTTGVRELLGEHFLGFLAGSEVPALLRRTEAGTPLCSLVRLFLAGTPVDRRSAETALAPLALEEAVGAGLVTDDGDRVRGRVRLRPYEADGHQFVVASDAWPAVPPGGRDGGTVASDHVIGVGASSAMLARMTIRNDVGRALDVGSGSGVQALHASLHAREVITTDVNPRALQFARFTLELSRVANVTTRQGDLFSSVPGERFGLIVSNPPYVISPETRLAFRDGGLEGDGICRRLVREAPAHLERGGFCQLLANWVHPAGGNWKERLTEWFQDTGCDAWVIQRSTEDVEEYAVGWVLHGEPDESDEDTQSKVLDEWMSYYERLGIERIGFGLITMRLRESGRPFVRFEDLPHDPGRPCGDDIARSFELTDWLDSLGSDDELLDARLAVAPDVHLHRDLVPSPRGFEARASELRRATGLGRRGLVDEHGARVVGGCDGTTILRALLGDLASALDADTDAVTSAALPIVRSLVEQGFLVPAAN